MRPALFIICILWLPLLCAAQGFYKAVPIADCDITLNATSNRQALRITVPMYTVRIIYAITPVSDDTSHTLLQEVRSRLPQKLDWLGVEAISRQLTTPMLPDSITAALYNRKGCVKRFMKKRRTRCISYMVEPLVARTWHHEWPGSIFNEKAYLCLRNPDSSRPLTCRIQAVAVQAY